MLSNNVYDILKKIALLVAPLVTFLTSISSVLGVNLSSAVSYISLSATLLGVVLEWSSSKYNKGIDEPIVEEEISE